MTSATYTNHYDTPAYQSGNWKKPGNMRNLVSMVLLMVFTLGIYFLYWVYQTTEYANRDKSTPHHTPVVQLLLVMFVPYYELYWFYKTSKKLTHLGEPFEVFDDNSIVTLLLGIFGLDFIGAVVLQDQINKIEAVTSGAGIGATGEAVCKHCHTVFPNDAHTCPKCGYPYKKPFTKTIGFAILVAALGILLIAGLLIGIIYYGTHAQPDEGWNWNEITSGQEAGNNTSKVDELREANSPKYGEVMETAPGRWALVKDGVVNTDFTGIAENENGIWYLENGYVNFNFSGTLEDGNGNSYTVEQGKVVNQQTTD